MAQGSFILQQTRGSVGNIVVRRNEGKTILSAKPTSVKNPRTFAQAEVRMRMAAVTRFYSPLSQVLEQGLEGGTTMQSQSAFIKKNIEIMRDNSFGWPKEADFGPMPFRLSKGSIPSVGAYIDITSQNTTYVSLYGNPKINDPSGFYTIGDCAKFLKQLYSINSDTFQLTIIAVERRVIDNVIYYFPYYDRVQFDTTSQESISTYNSGRFWRFPGEYLPSGDEFNFLINFDCHGVGIILSYYNVAKQRWMRSTEYLSPSESFLANLKLESNYQKCVETFMDSSSITTPDGRVYLDGYEASSRSSESGGGADYDLTTFLPVIGGTQSTAHVTDVVYIDTDDNTLVGVTLSDGTSHIVSMGSRLISVYKKGVTSAGGHVDLTDEQFANAAVFLDAGSTSQQAGYNFYSYLSEQTGIPLAAFMTTQS